MLRYLGAHSQSLGSCTLWETICRKKIEPADQTTQAQPNVGSRCVHPHHKRLAKNRDMKEWGTCEHSLEAVKCRLLNSRPAPNLIFPNKVQQRGSNMRKVVHILAIIVVQTKELLYKSDAGGCGALRNGHKLGWVCVDLAMANYVTQVVNLALKKYAFLRLPT